MFVSLLFTDSVLVLVGWLYFPEFSCLFLPIYSFKVLFPLVFLMISSVVEMQYLQGSLLGVCI